MAVDIHFFGGYPLFGLEGEKNRITTFGSKWWLSISYQKSRMSPTTSG
jgi:hypothetical protein